MEISDFHNIHSGKRCFILGNGPSLTKINLSKLRDEITFGSNEIYRLPNINLNYFILGGVDYLDISKVINFKCEIKFVSRRLFPFKKYSNVVLMKLLDNPRVSYPFFPKFSLDCNKYLYTGGTASYLCLQLAVYMGCNSIYLIGFDWWDKYDEVPMELKHFFKECNESTFSATDERITLAVHNHIMKAGGKFLKRKNVEVYNMTPNTKLKAFEKKNFEDLEFNEIE